MPVPRSATDHDLDNSPGGVQWALHQFVVAATALDVTLSHRLGLSPIEYQAMKHVMTSVDPIGPVELGTLVGLTSGSATTLVDRLERAGHIVRHRDASDRRRVALEATAEALTNARQQLRPLEGALEEVLAGCSSEDRQVIARFLRDATNAYQRFNR
jgi:DNA-binding MarR family transcriptional regulator